MRLDYPFLIGKVFALPTEEVNPITLNSDTNNTDINQTSDDSSQPIPSSEISIDNPLNNTEIIIIPDTDFDPKEEPSLIDDLVVFNKTELCITRYYSLLSFMTNAEQIAFINAFRAIKINETSIENTGRCFSPGYFKKIFNKIVKGTIRKININRTAKSRRIRNSFTCNKITFDKNKSKGDFNKAIIKVVNSQAESNKFLVRFLKVLYETLSSRRRYLLLSINDINSTAIIENNTIVGFPWIDNGVINITSSFLKYAECFQDCPNSMVESYSEIQGLLAQDSSRALTLDTTRYLQKKTEKVDTKSNNSKNNNSTSS
jgi:hypothetical protein